MSRMAAVVVLGAAGKGGSLVVTEAAARGHDVTAVVRRDRPEVEWPDAVTVVVADATSPEDLAPLLANADTVVSTVGGPGQTIYTEVAQALVSVISDLPQPRPRIIHMGGGASLLLPDGQRILDGAVIPEAYLDAARGQSAALDFYRASSGVTWTFFSPPPMNFFQGERRGVYRTGSDHPVVDAEGESRLSYQDFAVAVVDEIENRRHLDQRFTAAY
jgi:putative NADH-flavin reductase